MEQGGGTQAQLQTAYDPRGVRIERKVFLLHPERSLQEVIMIGHSPCLKCLINFLLFSGRKTKFIYSPLHLQYLIYSRHVISTNILHPISFSLSYEFVALMNFFSAERDFKGDKLRLLSLAELGIALGATETTLTHTLSKENNQSKILNKHKL